jgi:hypothetical protein
MCYNCIANLLYTSRMSLLQYSHSLFKYLLAANLNFDNVIMCFIADLKIYKLHIHVDMSVCLYGLVVRLSD